MDPITLAALISTIPSLAALNWKEILEGKNATMKGWHGMSANEKNALTNQLLKAAFETAITTEGRDMTPAQIYWQLIAPYVVRPSEKTLAAFLNVNPGITQVFIPQYEKNYGFGFNEKAPAAAALKSQLSASLSSPYIMYGIIGLALLWIVSIVVKMTKK